MAVIFFSRHLRLGFAFGVRLWGSLGVRLALAVDWPGFFFTES